MLGTAEFSPFIVIDCVSKPWRVHNGEFEFDSFLLDVDRVFGDLNRLINTLCYRKHTILTHQLKRCTLMYMLHYC